MTGSDLPRLLVSGAEYGGPLASKMVTAHLRQLQNLSESAINNIKTDPLVTIFPFFRVDGSISYWQKEGVERVRFTRRDSTVSLEAMVPQWRWKDKTRYEIREYL